jgi:hypothetical protein
MMKNTGNTNEVIVIGTIGRPGSTASCKGDPLDMGHTVDVQSVLDKELEDNELTQRGYNSDAKKYKTQVENYNDKSRN